MFVTGEAPGKLLLFGEHAAVYGYPAIGVPLPLKMHLTLSPALDYRWTMPSVDAKLNTLLTSLLSLVPELKKLPPFEISLDSKIPSGAGFGSSAALCVSLVRAAHYYMSVNLTDQKINELAHTLETTFHHSPSGIDTGLATFNRLCFFQKKESSSPMDCSFIEMPSLYLVVGAVQRKSSTLDLVMQVANQRQTDPQVQTRLCKLGSLAQDFLSSLNIYEPQKFGLLATEAQMLLTQLNLSTPELDHIFKRSTQWGALGGKLSGAGGGGAFYLVASSQLHAQILLNCLQNEFYSTLIASFVLSLPSNDSSVI